MKKFAYLQCCLLLLSSFFLCFTPGVYAQALLLDVIVSPDHQGAQVQMKFDLPVMHFTAKLHAHPYRLIVDIANTRSALKTNTMEGRGASVKNITIETKPAGIRIIIALTSALPYRLSPRGTLLNIVLGKGDINNKEVQSLGPVSAQHLPEKITRHEVLRRLNRIKKVRFNKGKSGQGQLRLTFLHKNIEVNFEPQHKQLMVVIKNTQIEHAFLSRLDVSGLATAVNKIETIRKDTDIHFLLDMQHEYDYFYEQSKALLLINIVKKVNEPSTTHFQGKKLSFNFQDITVRHALQLIAEFHAINVVISDAVKGNLTLYLEDVPWDQALDIILKVKGLAKKMQGNVLVIAPIAELLAQERAQLASHQKVAELTPLHSEFIQINYANVTDIANMLQGDDLSLLSKRGTVSLDVRTNTLLLKDSREVIDTVKEMLGVLDVPVRQVIIEARMVTVSDSVGKELGIRWGQTSSNKHISSAGTLPGIATGADLNARLNVNLPVANAAGSIAFQVAKLIDGHLLDLELSALEQENKAEIIASPRITTANQQTAYIEQGSEVPYTESSSQGVTTIRFKKAVLSLQVTPQITPDNKVVLDLMITQNSIGDTISTGTGTAVAIDTQEISTQVLVNNGETLVLGGIYQQRVSSSISKVPLLGDIPYLGVLFRRRSESIQKSELLIFVTPHIVTQATY